MTQDRKSSDQKRTRTAVLYATYGADRSRWPQADAEAAAPTGPDDAHALQHRDALDIDRLLDAASTPRVPDGAMARLMGRVDAIGEAAAGSTVVAMDQARRRSRVPATGWGWKQGFALLAASLVLGIYLGQAEFMTEIVGDAFTTADAGSDAVGEALYWLSFDPDALTEETL